MKTMRHGVWKAFVFVDQLHVVVRFTDTCESWLCLQVPKDKSSRRSTLGLGIGIVCVHDR